ncbi:RDD family protein [Micromonospora sp. NPDC049559]|uniref:RDD family protein n=1 Tax=Micromonospora sp. NPDC049559 TaxID=3155923 RepID=UPI00343C88DD
MTQPPAREPWPPAATPPPPPGPAPAGPGIPHQPGPGAVPLWDPAAPGYGPPGRYHFTPPPPPLSPAGQPLASFADRLLAHLIDGAVFTVVGMLLAIPAFIFFFLKIQSDLQVQPDGTLAEPDFVGLFGPLLLIELGLVVAMLVVAYVYYVELMFRSGQTLGKRVMKIKVVPLSPAASLDRAGAARRYLVQFVAAMFVPGASYVDGLWQLWDKPYQQCLHDKFARTVVVKVPG